MSDIDPNILSWRPISVDDYLWINQMRDDDEIRLNLHNCDKFSTDNCYQWIKNLPSTSRRYAIKSKTHNDPIGLFRIDNIDFINRNCYFGLDISEAYRGCGYAKPIWRIMLKEWFNNYNMNYIYLEVLYNNYKAYKLYSELGFCNTGYYPCKIFRHNSYVDSIIMALSKEKFKNE